MWYFPSDPGNGKVDALSGCMVTAVNASGTIAAVDPVVAVVVGTETIIVDDDAVFGLPSAELEPRPLGEHAARASAAARRNAVWSLCAARLGGLTGFTPRTIAPTPLLRKSSSGPRFSSTPPAQDASPARAHRPRCRRAAGAVPGRA